MLEALNAALHWNVIFWRGHWSEIGYGQWVHTPTEDHLVCCEDGTVMINTVVVRHQVANSGLLVSIKVAHVAWVGLWARAGAGVDYMGFLNCWFYEDRHGLHLVCSNCGAVGPCRAEHALCTRYNDAVVPALFGFYSADSIWH